MRTPRDILNQLRDHLRERKRRWINRWRVGDWMDRTELLAPLIAGAILVVAAIAIAIWLGLWFFFGPPFVQIGDIKVELDRTSTLTGVDADKNGIRDDIDKFIHVLAEKKGYKPEQVRALEQMSRAMQMGNAINAKSIDEVKASNDAYMRASNCLWDKVGEDDWNSFTRKIESVSINTRQRVSAYIESSHTLSGSVVTLPSGDTCEK